MKLFVAQEDKFILINKDNYNLGMELMFGKGDWYTKSTFAVYIFSLSLSF